MLINLSNHPSNLWSDKQMKIAKHQFGDVKDLPFPHIEPQSNEDTIIQLSQEYYMKIVHITSARQENITVHIMGEFTFVFALVNLLLKNNIDCVASTTKRNVQLDAHGNKVSEFDFVQFRKYKHYE